MKSAMMKLHIVVLAAALSAGVALKAQSLSGDGADSLRVQADSTDVPAAVSRVPADSSMAAAKVPHMPADVAEMPTDTRLLARADSLYGAYMFREAARLCGEIEENSRDSLVRLYASELMSMAENGFRMSSDVALPTVIARQKFTLKDFFLYYPFPDRSWHDMRQCQGLRDSLGTVMAPAVLKMLPDIVRWQEGDDAVYFSSPDTLGNMKIFCSSAADSLWTRPRPVFPAVPADSSGFPADSTMFAADSATFSADSAAFPAPPVSDEIFPVLSADRRSLYFSAKRQDSAGGYDLYESVWSESDSLWTEPVNLGFPYSSVDNDYLYMNTDDGRYTVFASDRGCSGDSVYVYVLEYEFVPERAGFSDSERLRQVMELIPSEGTDVVDAGSALGGGIPENSDTKRYMEKMEVVRSLRDVLDRTCRGLEQMREEFAFSDDVERRQELMSSILETEAKIPQLQEELDRAAAEVQKIEMEFLLGGVVIDYARMSQEASLKVVGESSRYVFKERKMGAPLEFGFVKEETSSAEVLPTE